MKTLRMKGKSNHDLGLTIAGERRGSDQPISSLRNDDYLTIPGRDGAIHQPGELQVKTFTVYFVKVNTSYDRWLNERPEIAGWLDSRKEVEITTDENSDCYMLGKVTNYELPEFYANDITFSVEFTVQPFMYYKESVVDELSLVDGKATYLNKSNYETPYTMNITVQNTAVGLELSVNNQKLSYDRSLRSGDLITIDTEKRELRLNGELKVLEVDGVFEKLRPGRNEIKSSVSGPHELIFRGRMI